MDNQRDESDQQVAGARSATHRLAHLHRFTEVRLAPVKVDLQTNDNRPPVETDVVVVGGGVSGLATARALIASGRSVRVLEASKRAGGRLWSVQSSGGAADMGATWFWPGEERVRALIDDLGIAWHDQALDGDTLVWNGAGIHRIAGNHLDVAAFRFSDGGSSLVEELVESLPSQTVSYGTVVQSIDRAPNGVTIQTSQGPTTSRVVVVALAPSVAIATGLIDPATLTQDVRDAATAIPVWMGATTKAVAVYDAPFWRASGLAGAALCMVNTPLQEIHDMSGPGGSPAMLFGFGSSRSGRPPITPESVALQMGELFGDRAAAPTAVHIRDWSEEPGFSETISDAYHLFGSPHLQRSSWDDRLLWTSTETSTIAPGHLEGALAAAERTTGLIAASWQRLTE